MRKSVSALTTSKACSGNAAKTLTRLCLLAGLAGGLAVSSPAATQDQSREDTARRACIQALMDQGVNGRFGRQSFKVVMAEKTENGLRFSWPERTIVGRPNTTAACHYRDGQVTALTINGETVTE